MGREERAEGGEEAPKNEKYNYFSTKNCPELDGMWQKLKNSK